MKETLAAIKEETERNVLCISLDNLAFPVKLEQQGIDQFTVTYGLQVKRRLSYNDAATELGASIMHALACDGLLDNREKGEQ